MTPQRGATALTQALALAREQLAAVANLWHEQNGAPLGSASLSPARADRARRQLVLGHDDWPGLAAHYGLELLPPSLAARALQLPEYQADAARAMARVLAGPQVREELLKRYGAKTLFLAQDHAVVAAEAALADARAGAPQEGAEGPREER